LRHAPPENAARILLETERLLRIYGHRKITVADIADACGFSAANVYRYFSSRRAILDALASHYLHETERAALACANCNRDSARDRLSGFLSGLNTALIIFADREPQVSELLADATTEQWPCTSTMMRASFATSPGYSPQRAHPENSGWLAMPGRKPAASRRQPVPWSSRTSSCPTGTATTPPRARP
jgi:AcrR family transcriptional regulator